MIGNGIHFAARLFFSAALLYGALSLMASARAQAPAPTPTPLGVDIPHIALLLPMDSSTFQRHAEALRDGFLAASQFPDPPRLLIRVYAVGGDPRLAAASYQQAVNSGARLVIGPLVRSAAAAVAAGNVPVPTLLLNEPGGVPVVKPNLYVLSLQVESEAQQLAQLAIREGRRNAFTVVGDSPLLERVHKAFTETFIRLGGRIATTFTYVPSPIELDRLRNAVAAHGADMAFLALDSRVAGVVRPMLDPLPLYASSQTYSADPVIAAGLAGIRMLDMPWLAQPDHSAVMIYPRRNYPDPDFERLYALGIDAWRIGQALLAHHTDINLDGVTGRLALGRDRRFSRQLVLSAPGSQADSAIPPGPISPAAPVAYPAALPPAVRP